MRRLITLFIALALFSAPAFSQKKDIYRVRTIVIDPGHGGAKPGAQGGRIQEKDLTLSIAKKFGKLVSDNYPDVKVIYTRTTDVDISLAERAHIANRNKADLFISIHINSHPTAIPTGVETFVMGLSESRANLEVAKKENADILLESDYKSNEAYKGFDPNAPESFVMLAMFQNAFLDKSLNFAQAIQNQYKQNLKTINRGVKQAELFVLYKTTCPSVLTEVGFISNPAEEAFMMSDEGQAKIAISLFNAFMTYKATEEGINKIANPKIELPGYNSPKPEPVVAEAPKPEPVVAETPKPEPVVAEVVKPKPEPAPAPAPKPAPSVETQPAASQTVAAPQPTPAASQPEPKKPVTPAVERPLPTRELTPQPKPEPIPEPKVEAPAPEPEPIPEVKLEPVAEPAPAPVAKPAKSEVTAPLAAPRNSAKAAATEFFTVQFLTSATELSAGDPAFNGIENVMVSRNGQLYCYSVGRFSTFAEANEYSKEVQAKTSFKDAWAVRRKAASTTTPPKTTSNTSTPSNTSTTSPTKNTTPAVPTPSSKADDRGTHYRIQFCTASRILKAGDSELEGIKDIRYTQSGKYYIYSCGNYKNLAEARKRLATIHQTTSFKDAFIFGTKNGKRFKVE